jgi:hypothetical protein
MSQFQVVGSAMGNELQAILASKDIVPGDTPSYQLCKTLYLYHPLGAKMAESPVKMAQSKPREISVPDSPGDRVKKAFEAEWKALGCDRHIFNMARLSRVYGVASVALMAEGTPPNRPVDYRTLPDQTIAFNVYDPLNTAGSLVLNQNALAMDFQKVQRIAVSGQEFHPSRACVLLNEEPIYIAYTPSGFGYVGRSVYQRALFPMKSFLQTMLTDDLVSIKAGVLVAKMAQPGSIIDNLMAKLYGQKRQLLKDAALGNVLSIGPEDDIQSLNFQNLDGPYALVRTNILKNIATSADMPAVMLENETLTEGFGEGTEDAKNIAKYVDGVREWMEPAYVFMTKIVQYRAWTPDFYKTVQADFPEEYGGVGYTQAFYRWVNSFVAIWPSLLTEPPSEQQKVEKTKLDSIVDLVKTLMPDLDPANKALLVQWAADNFNTLKLMFEEPLVLDYDTLAEYEPPVPGFGEPGAGGEGAVADSQVARDLAGIRRALLRMAHGNADDNARILRVVRDLGGGLPAPRAKNAS